MASSSKGESDPVLSYPKGSVPVLLRVWYYADPLGLRDVTTKAAALVHKQLPKKLRGLWQISAVPPDDSVVVRALQEAETLASVPGNGISADNHKAFVCIRISFVLLPEARIWAAMRNGEKEGGGGGGGDDGHFDEKTDLDHFEDLFEFASGMMKKTGGGTDCFKAKIPGLADANLCCWMMWNTEEMASRPAQMTRLVLPPPTCPVLMPAEKIEHVLYNLVHLKPRRRDASHDLCDNGAGLACVERQLYVQKTVCAQLFDALDLLKSLHYPSIDQINQTIDRIEQVDTSFGTIIDLYRETFGLGPSKGRGLRGRSSQQTMSPWPTTQGRSYGCLSSIFYGGLFKLRSKFGRGPSKKKKNSKKSNNKSRNNTTTTKPRSPSPIFNNNTTIASELVPLLRALEREHSGLRRIAYLLVAHVRLRHPTHWKPLKNACDNASAGPEKCEMPEKMAIKTSRIGEPEPALASLAKVRRLYEEQHGKLLGAVEAVSKGVGRVMMENDGMFRWGAGSRCLVEEMEGKVEEVEKKRDEERKSTTTTTTTPSAFCGREKKCYCPGGGLASYCSKCDEARSAAAAANASDSEEEDSESDGASSIFDHWTEDEKRLLHRGE